MPGRERLKQLAFFGVLLVAALFLLAEANKLALLVRGSLGPGLYPALVLGVLALLTLAAIVELLVRRELLLLSPFLEGLQQDTLLRRLAAAARGTLGRPVRVTPRNGSGVFSTLHAGQRGDGSEAVAVVASETPDLAPHETAAYVRARYAPVARLFFEPDALAAGAASPARNLADFFAAAAGRPPRIGFVHQAAAAAPILEWLARHGAAGVEPTYGEDAKLLLAGLGRGDYDAVVVPLEDAAEAVARGEAAGLAALADAAADARGLMPTTAEQGYPLEFGSWAGLALPKNAADPDRRTHLWEAFAAAFDRYRLSGERQEGDAAWAVLPPQAFDSFLAGFAASAGPGRPAPALPRGQVTGLLGAVAAVLLFPGVMELLGFPLAAFLFLAGLMTLLWPRLEAMGFLRILAVSAVLAIGLYQLFWKTFYVVFPEGLLFGG